MKLVLKILLSIILLLMLIIGTGIFITPNVTIMNHSDIRIEQVSVKLPSNNLDFGFIEAGLENTIYYDMEQLDGSYHYRFNFIDKTPIIGSCGYVTNSEVHKRMIITLTDEFHVICNQ